MTKKMAVIISLILIATILMPTLAMAKEKREVKFRDYHPMRYIAFVIYGLGVIADELVAKPLQRLVSCPKVREFVGYQPDEIDYYEDMSRYAY